MLNYQAIDTLTYLNLPGSYTYLECTLKDLGIQNSTNLEIAE